MKDFIERKMYKIFDDFKRDLNRIGRFCDIKKFRFDSDNIPDYKDPLIQKYYLLRYLPAYLTEYYIMYKNMLMKNFITDTLNIISVGTGCGLDYWGLKFAIDDLDIYIPVRYTGLDSVNWGYWDNLGSKTCWFLHDDINNLKKLDENEYNIIVFPKSIGEFEYLTFFNLEDVIKNTQFNSDKIILLSSLRKSRKDQDSYRLAKIGEILEKYHGYKCLDDNRKLVCYEKNQNGYYDRLNYVCRYFTYPFEIFQYMITLNEKCEGYIHNWFQPCDDDCKNMNRSPILTTSQIYYQVLRFQKE